MRSTPDSTPDALPDAAFCAVAPSPQLIERVRAAAAAAAAGQPTLAAVPLTLPGAPRLFGMDDGVIIPPGRFAMGASPRTIRRAASQRAPLRGAVRVVVVLAQFTDKAIGQTADHFRELFFSTGAIATGSVTEYFRDVTGGLVEIIGEVVGPYTMPQPLAWYANNNFGIGRPSGEPRANVLARDAVAAADPQVNFAPYDNDGNGFVDAFIVVHAGSGGEETGNPGDIWSHKWVLPSEYPTDGTSIYAYLTIPEDAKLGVSAHELGHLVFGFPDLYDIDGTSEGVGNWCLMGGGSWNGGGDTPAHPSAWCKANQGWVSVTNVTTAGELSLPDVKDSKTVHRLWTDGAQGQEYFVLENRQQTGYDAELPAGGLLLWHVDDGQQDNSDESHYLVGLVQADGSQDLEHGSNRGDGGDCFPGDADVRACDATTTPATTSYSGQDTSVSLSDISDAGSTMTVSVRVSATPDGGEGGDGLESRVRTLEEQLSRLSGAVSAAAADLTAGTATGAPAASPASIDLTATAEKAGAWSPQPRT